MATTDVQTGATAGGNAPVGYAQGVSNPPNGGQVTDVDNPEPNDAPTMVPIFAPDGSFGEVPLARVHDALNAGGKRAEYMVSPDGKGGYIPQDRVQDAVKAGAKFGSPDVHQSTAQLYREALFNPVGSGAASGVSGGLEQAGGRAMQGITAPLLHPLDTLSGIAHTIAHPIDTAEQRINEFKQEWKQNPTLALENAAGDVVGAVEGGRLGSAALSKAADVAAPLAGRAALLGRTPEEAYESALKPSTVLPQAARDRAVATGLSQNIPISKAGLERLGEQIDEYNQQIANKINSAGPNRSIAPGKAVQNLAETRSKFASQVNPQGDLAAIDNSEQQFLDQFRSQPGGAVRNMTAQEAQAMKQGTYRVLAGKYGEQGSAAVEAQKALARGIKDEIARQFPEINTLNASESRLLDLQPILERAVNRISNHQLIGIGTPVAGAAAKAVTGSATAGVVATALKAVLDNPAVKSRLAIAVSKGARIPYAQAASRVAAYSAALGSYAESPADAYPSAK